jgi:hypothetical protein
MKVPFLDEMDAFDWKAHRFLARFFKYRDIVKKEDGKETLYLRRFYLIRKGPFKLFLHNIRRSDSDRDQHDHPWDFSTICLRGGYIEYITKDPGSVTPKKDVRYFGPRDVLKNKAEHTHRVELLHDAFKHIPYQSTWTLVHTKKARRVWGFWVNGYHRDWRTYLGLPNNTPDSEEDRP